MIMAWLGTKALGLQRWVWVVVLLLATVGAYVWLTQAEEADDKANQEIGAKVQREGDLRETIKRAEKANEARDDISRDRDNARYEQCLHTARTPANCERLRVVQAD